LRIIRERLQIVKHFLNPGERTVAGHATG
jgi:hypothetical protein